MFAGHRQYDTYRASGSPWMKVVPASWQMQRVKSLLSERVAKGFPEEPLLAATQSRGVIRKSDYGIRTVTATKDLHLLKRVDIGDFVISLRSFQGGIERCYHRGIISPAYTVLVAKSDTYSAYLTYLFKAKPFVSSLTLAVTGIREGQNIDYSRLAGELLPVPPPEEQAAIVKYLAHANARIDKAIAAKRRLIALLEEQRNCLINEFMLKGGRKWQQRRLKTLLTGIDQGVSPQADNQAPGPKEWGVLKAGCINGGVFRADQVKRLPKDFAIPEQLVVREGDILVSRASGSPRLVGSTARVPGIRLHAILSDKIFRLRVGKEVDPDFLVLAMNASPYREQVSQAISGAEGMANNLPVTALRSFIFNLPPLAHQSAIVSDTKSQSAVLLATIDRTQTEIALLTEFRTRLTADVVTGQVDVRGIAASLPEVDPGAFAAGSQEDPQLPDSGIDELAEFETPPGGESI